MLEGEITVQALVLNIETSEQLLAVYLPFFSVCSDASMALDMFFASLSL